jgi:hypothetical protein
MNENLKKLIKATLVAATVPGVMLSAEKNASAQTIQYDTLRFIIYIIHLLPNWEQWAEPYNVSLQNPVQVYGTQHSVDIGNGVVARGVSSGDGGGVGMHTMSGETLQLTQVLHPANTVAGDQFGASVGLDPSTFTSVFAGAPGKNSGSGAVYPFSQNTSGQWSQGSELDDPQSPRGADSFGSSVAVFGNMAVVGAPGTGSSKGSAYVYTRNGTDWSPTPVPLLATDGAQGDMFGTSVALQGSIILVGAPGKNGGSGQVYVFGLVGGSWSQMSMFSGATGDFFGNSVALSADGKTAVVGGPGPATGTAGVAYLFKGLPSNPVQAQTLQGGGGGFGYSVAMSPAADQVFVGAGHSPGPAVFFQLSGTSLQQMARIQALKPGGDNDITGLSVAHFPGRTSLLVTPLAANTPGNFFALDASTFVPALGDKLAWLACGLGFIGIYLMTQRRRRLAT